MLIVIFGFCYLHSVKSFANDVPRSVVKVGIQKIIETENAGFKRHGFKYNSASELNVSFPEFNLIPLVGWANAIMPVFDYEAHIPLIRNNDLFEANCWVTLGNPIFDENAKIRIILGNCEIRDASGETVPYDDFGGEVELH